MRTETRTYDVYKVDELSFTAKENAYNRWLAGYEYPWQSENMATLKAFEGILCGVRLLKFIVNNYWHSLFKPKTYWHGKDFNKQRRSRISVTEDCVLTGYCADMDILKPIYDFLKAPDKHTNLHDLMDECIGSFFRFCSRDVEDCTDEEAFEHDCEANGYEFLSNGEFFN